MEKNGISHHRRDAADHQVGTGTWAGLQHRGRRVKQAARVGGGRGTAWVGGREQGAGTDWGTGFDLKHTIEWDLSSQRLFCSE